ncbi:linaridin-like RiPP [Streptomyces sp. NPDC048584]|uniref:linaridin-like RiPP n=1 Tax=Streptomyces sp. NPDC048584 TaxID=3365573 RepID=UPI0037171E4C
MSLVAQFANEALADVSPGMLSEADAASPLDTPADPVMATFLTVTCPEVAVLAAAGFGALAANINNYLARNAY